MEHRLVSEVDVRRKPILRWSLGTKLIIVLLALAILPMAATSYYNLTRGQDEVARVARENLIELSRSTAHRIELLLTENQRTSATLAGDPLAVEFLAASDALRQDLAPRVYRMLQNFADTHPDYDAPGLLDAKGIVVASLADVLVGKDRSFRDYFQASIQGEPYVSDMLVGRATGRPGVFLTNPVITPEGRVVGIDIVWLKGDAIWAIIDDIVVGDEGIAYLVDQDGVIIAHPERDLLYRSLANLTPEAADTISATIRFGTVEGTETPLIPESLGMDDLAGALLASGQASGSHRYHSPIDHRDHVVGYTRLESYPWTVVVDLPEDQFMAPLKRLALVSWITVGFMGVIALLISILVVRGITRPVRHLAQAAGAVERGESFQPADIEDVTSGHDEIAHLGRVFSGMVLALRQELTERRKAEEALREYSERLEEMVEERTKELRDAQDQLVRQEKLAVLGRLAGSMAHEMRNPLGAIKNAAYFLNMALEEPEPEVKETLDILRKEVGTCGRIISSLLDFARAKLPTRRKVDINEVVREVLSRVAVPGSIEVLAQLDDELPTIMADLDQLAQVFGNIVLNAIQAMPEGGQLVVKLEACRGKPTVHPGWVAVSFTDTGVGIPVENLAKLFEPLFTTKAKGIGLGLALAKTLVDAHGGSIEVESEVDKGSTFAVKLPCSGKEGTAA